MAIKTYIEDDQKKRYEVYVNLRSKKISTLRLQRRRKGIETQAEALRIEKRFLKELSVEIANKEGTSSIWRIVIERWAIEARKGYFSAPLSETWIQYSDAILKKWTGDWLEVPCEELNHGHGRQVIKRLLDEGLSKSYIKKIKGIINQVFNFGIAERLIQGVSVSPVHGITLHSQEEEKMKEILTLDECQKLLSEARRHNHPWYHVWAMALNTGCRSGELYALRKDSVDYELGVIRIVHSWDFANEKLKSTKKSYWRNVPLSTDLNGLISGIEKANPEGEFLLPRLQKWSSGDQAQVLREFCKFIGIPSIKFHTLRACFATHMLAAGVEPSVVRLIGGWKDIKSFQIYIRLSGISEKGATDALRFLTPERKKDTVAAANLRLITL